MPYTRGLPARNRKNFRSVKGTEKKSWFFAVLQKKGAFSNDNVTTEIYRGKGLEGLSMCSFVRQEKQQQHKKKKKKGGTKNTMWKKRQGDLFGTAA